MTRYLVLYRATTSATEQMAGASAEQAQAGMDAWMTWSRKAGDAVVDLGSPLAVVTSGGDAGDPVGGYSILQAQDPSALAAVLDGHPHYASGGTIQVLEFLPMPGM